MLVYGGIKYVSLTQFIGQYCGNWVKFNTQEVRLDNGPFRPWTQRNDEISKRYVFYLTHIDISNTKSEFLEFITNTINIAADWTWNK